MKKEALATEKAILANIPDCLRSKSLGLELGLKAKIKLTSKFKKI
jgi:hypothetical protein